jgi:hypothetical protein
MFNTEKFKDDIEYASFDYWCDYNYLVSHPKYTGEEGRNKIFTYEEEWLDDDQEEEEEEERYSSSKEETWFVPEKDYQTFFDKLYKLDQVCDDVEPVEIEVQVHWWEDDLHFDVRWSDLDDELSGEMRGISGSSVFAANMSYWCYESDSEDED